MCHVIIGSVIMWTAAFILLQVMDIEEILLLIEANLELEEAAAVNRVGLRRYFIRQSPMELITETQFIKIFRLSKNLALDLINLLTPFMEAPRRRSALSIEAKVLAALRFYASGSYQEITATNHYIGMSQASISRSIAEVTDLLIRNEITERWIKFPVNLEELRALRTRFYNKFEVPGIVGVIDCTHVAIVTPQGDPEHPEHVYVNRKNYHSINCQLVCDENLTIMHVNASFPGSVHDSHIWRQSNVSDFMERIYRRNPNDPYFLIGDSGYPMRPWIMTPLREIPVENSPEWRFDKAFKRARNTIERCNGVWKARFRCLLRDRTLHYHPVKASKIAKACAVLHNMCLNRGEPDPEIEQHINLDGLGAGILYQENVNEDLVLARQLQRSIINTHFT